MYRSNILTAFVSLMVGLFVCRMNAYAQENQNNCVACHVEINEEIVTAFQTDAHAHAGISCVDCHGGNPAIDDEDGMDPSYGFIGVPERKDEPRFCGKCHSNPSFMRAYNPSIPTDQVAKYWTSQHGALLEKNDKKVATCTSCHNSHGILPSNSPRSSIYPINVPMTCGACHSDKDYMAGYDIPTEQFEQYADSANVHGYALFVKRDMSAPACNDCHGNHGAAPPGIENVGQVCTQCHALNGELFRNSPHKEAFDAFELPECVFCHQASPNIDEPHKRIHTITSPSYELIGVGDKAICSQCHSEGDTGWETASIIGEWRKSLDARLKHTTELLENVEARGFEISDARWMIDGEVKQAKMELRTIIHSFNLEKYEETYIRADTTLENVIDEGKNAEKEVTGRRIYFAMITIFIALVAMGLIMKIKEIEEE